MEDASQKVKLRIEDGAIARVWVFPIPKTSSSSVQGFGSILLGMSEAELLTTGGSWIEHEGVSRMAPSGGRILINTGAELLGSKATAFAHLYREKVSGILVTRPLAVQELLRKKPFFREVSALLVEKYGSASTSGLKKYASLGRWARMEESESRFLWSRWVKGPNSLELNINSSGPGTPVLSLLYFNTAYRKYWIEEGKRKKLSGL